MNSTRHSETVTQGLREIARDTPIEMEVVGSSMLPLLEPGNRVLISARRGYLPGDVVAFRSRRGELFIHRVVGYRPYFFGCRIQTAGDSAPSLDTPVEPNQILGRVVAGDYDVRIFKIPLLDRIRAGSRFVDRIIRKVTGL